MKESKILLMEQLSAYANSGSSGVLKRTESKKVFTDNKPNLMVESFIVKESKLNEFLTDKKDIDKFEITQRNNHAKSFHLLRLGRTEEIDYSYRYPDEPFYKFALIFSLTLLTIFAPLSLRAVLLGTSLTSPGLLWSLLITAFLVLLLVSSTHDLLGSKTAKEKVFYVESIEVSKKDFELISNLKSQSLEHDFNDLFELFCEAYWDSKVNSSKEATKTSKIIADRIIEKLSIAVESESEEEAMVKNGFDNKWRMIGKEL